MRGRNEGSIAKVVRKRRDGTEYIRYQASCSLGTGADGKRKRIKGPLREARPEAAADLRTMQGQIEHGVTPGRERLADYLATWLEHIEVKHRTRTTYESDIRNHVSPAIGQLRLCDITPAHVNAMLRRAKASSPSAARKARSVLHHALEDARREERILRNPVSLTAVPPTPKARLTTWEPEHAVAFIQAAGRHPRGTVFLLALGAGLRIGEALGLLWEDLEDGAVRITKQLRTVGRPVFDTLKTAESRRRLRLGSDLLAVLEAHRVVLMDGGRYVVGAYPSVIPGVPTVRGRLMFPHTTGGMTRLDSLRKPFREMLAAAEVPVIRIHDLRHYYISSLVQMGADPVTASRKAGHSRVSTTMDMYADAFEERLDQFVVTLDEIARADVEPMGRAVQGAIGRKDGGEGLPN